MSLNEPQSPISVLSGDFEHPPETAAGRVPPPLTSATMRLWQAFPPLSLERRRWALTVGAVETVKAGSAFSASSEVAVVVSGCLATNVESSELVAEILGPGRVVTTGGPRPITGQWITDGELYRVDLEEWLQHAADEGLALLLTAADERRAQLERRILCTASHLATARVADLFLSIQGAAAQPNILLSQETLGSMLGLRRTTVNGSCRALELGGATRTRRGRIRITHPDLLAQAACGCHRVTTRNREGFPAQIPPSTTAASCFPLEQMDGFERRCRGNVQP